MSTRSRSRTLRLLLAGAVAAAAVSTAWSSPVTAATPQLVTSEAVTYTFVVGDVGDPGGRLVLDVGHTDAIAPVFEDGELVVKTKDDTQLHSPGVVFRDPQDLIFQVRSAAQTSAPGFAPYDFLGGVGTPVWILPMTQNPSLLWPGWSTEHASLAGQFTDVQFQITDVAGPGEFHLFTNDAFGGIHRHLANNVGTLSNTWSEPVPAHVHANWAFTAPGAYEITVQVQGTWLNGPDPAPVETTLSITGAEGHFHTGDTVTLTAVQDPPTGEDHYHWFVRPAGASDFTVVSGALQATYSFTAAAHHDGAEYIAKLYDHDHVVIAESAPVTVEIDDHHGHEHDHGTIEGEISAPGGLAGVCAFLYEGAGSGDALQAACPGDDGHYHFEDLEPGEYTVAASDSLARHHTAWVPVTVEEDEETLVDIELVAAASIAGHITDGGTGAGVEACVYAYLVDGTPAGHGTCSRPDGVYALAGLPDGAYKLGFADPSGVRRTAWSGGAADLVGAATVEVVDGEVAVVDASLARPSRISISGSDGSGPVAGMCVYAYSVEAIDLDASVASFGSCAGPAETELLLDVDAGSWKLALFDPEARYATTWYSGAADIAGATPITVNAGEATTVDPVVLAPA